MDTEARVLFVDDEQDLLELFAEEFSEKGIQILLARSGYEAMEKITAGSISLVVTDYKMTHGDGISLANFCSDRGIACLVLTGHPIEEVRPYIPASMLVLNKARCMIEGSLERAIRDAIAAHRNPGSTVPAQVA